MRDKRRFKRVDVELPVTLRCGGRLIPATALNISCGGVYLTTEGADIGIKEKDSVEIVIDLSKEDHDVSLRGEVIRIESGEGGKVGVRFTNLYTVGHQTLESYININLN